jgi:D-galacturonate reductase
MGIRCDEVTRHIRAGMVGVGMIFDETYHHFFAKFRWVPLWDHLTERVQVSLDAVASRTGTRAARLAEACNHNFDNISGPTASEELATSDLDVVCVATPDDRHFTPAKAALAAGKHVLIEKPSVLSLAELDELTALADTNGVLCKVVYHKLLDPDHKKLRTHVADGVLRHVNSGYCSLLEPRSISTGQFAEWVVGRNPASYVAVHYLKLIDFTFGPEWTLSRVTASGQRGLVGKPPPAPPTWDSVLLRVVYTHSDGREAAFDIHTNWVNPDNFTGYVEQEVQFRFDNGIWLAHQRKRGVEVTVEGRSPNEIKNTPNHHYNADFLEPWGDRTNRGYGIEVIERFFREVAFVKFATEGTEHERLLRMNALTYNDIRSDRNVVAVVQSLEAILSAQADGHPDAVVKVNTPSPGLHLFKPGVIEPNTLYARRV